MKIRYHLTRLDIIRSSIRTIVFNRALMTYLIVFAGVMIGWSLKTAAQEGRGMAFLVFSAIFQLVAIVILIVIGLTITTSLALFFGKGRGIVGEHELEISDAGLAERTEFNDSLHKWKGVTAVRETSHFYFIRVNESGGAFHTLPKNGRCFEGDVHAFVAEIRKRIQAA